MINISIFLFLLINTYLFYIYSYQKETEIEIIIYLDIVVLIIILYQLFVYDHPVKKISNFTSNNDNIVIDLSNNPDVDDMSKTIIYWIVINNHESYNNFDMNGIATIDNKKVTINILNLESYPEIELKYRVDNKFNKLSTIIIK